jgi:hypothetical protein
LAATTLATVATRAKEDENYKIKREACVEFTGEGEKKDDNKKWFCNML